MQLLPMKIAFLALIAVLLISGCTTTGNIVYTEPVEIPERPEPSEPKPVEKITYSSEDNPTPVQELPSESEPIPEPMPEEPVDPCIGIHCGTSTLLCPDNHNATCQSYCSDGSCVPCEPDCSGHDAPEPEEEPVNETEPQETKIMFTKVSYDTPGKDSVEEWFELYNPTSSETDLSEWTVSDNSASWTIPIGTTIQPNSYIIIARNSTGFESLYGCQPDLEGFTRGLNNDGDQLILKDSAGTEIALVAWEGFLGWDLEAKTGTVLLRESNDIGPASWLNNQEINPC